MELLATKHRYYVLECDACKKPIGQSTDPKHPSRGITICNNCWNTPEHLPAHLEVPCPRP